MDLQRGLPYRRRLFAARHRKRSPLRRLAKPFFAALLLVGSPAALAAWVLTRPEFTLRQVEIRAPPGSTRSWVERELTGLRATRCSTSRPSWSKGDWRRIPWVAPARSASVCRISFASIWSSGGRRRCLRADGELAFVDADGVVFADFEPAIGVSDLLVLSGSSRPET